MLTPEAIESLQESCAMIANDNWGGGVSLEQDENGVLTFVSVNEDDEEEAWATATPCGSFEGHDLYRLQNPLRNPSYEGVITTLVPLLIVGYLGL